MNKIVFITLTLLFLISCEQNSSATQKKETKKTMQLPPQTSHVLKKVKPKVSTAKANKSQSLDTLANQSTLSKEECEEQFKNENGICEVPNPHYPKKEDQ